MLIHHAISSLESVFTNACIRRVAPVNTIFAIVSGTTQHLT